MDSRDECDGSQRPLLTRCDRCRDLVAELWPVTVRRRVELRCAMCADGMADVPRNVLRARLQERLAKMGAMLPYLSRW